MKHMIIIGDGMADERYSELGNKSPLEYANIPTLDRLAGKGIVGHAQNCPEELSCGSDTAIMSIMGCDPLVYFTGRGPMEAAALGFPVKSYDSVFRMNLLTMEDGDGILDEKGFISFNAGSIEGEDALEAVRELCADPEFAAALKGANMYINATPTFRQIAVQHYGDFKGLYFEPNWEGTQGPCKQVFPRGNDDKAKPYIELMRLANKALEHAPINEKRRAEGKLPANGVWFWAEGTASQMPSFKSEFGDDGAVVAAVPVSQGIGVLRGLEKIYVPGANGEIDTNIEGKLEAAWDQLHKKDFVFIHYEAPDECSHAGSLKDKIQSIEWLDSRLVGPLTQRMDEEGMEYRMLILSDHRTFVSTKDHERTPVPFIMYDSRVDTGRGLPYNEEVGMEGPFVERGHNLLSILYEKEGSQNLFE